MVVLVAVVVAMDFQLAVEPVVQEMLVVIHRQRVTMVVLVFSLVQVALALVVAVVPVALD